MRYMNVIGGILICSSLFASNQPENPPSTLTTETSWEMVDEDNDITIYERWIDLPDGRQTRVRKGVFYVDNDVEEIVPLISDPNEFKDWMNGVRESRQINQSNESSRMVYILFGAPWPFKNRDLVTEIITIRDCDKPCVEVIMTAKGNFIPEKNKVIRMRSFEGRWQISQTEQGQTKIVYSALSDTPPVAPKWLQDPVTAHLFKGNLLNLKDLLTLSK